MLSKKCQKYINKYEEKNYAPKVRKLEKSDIKQHTHRNKIGISAEASSSYSLKQSREIEEEKVVPKEQKSKSPSAFAKALMEAMPLIWE